MITSSIAVCINCRITASFEWFIFEKTKGIDLALRQISVLVSHVQVLRVEWKACYRMAYFCKYCMEYLLEYSRHCINRYCLVLRSSS